jgi:uncharacterized cupredoxin-like copper-binding protein
MQLSVRSSRSRAMVIALLAVVIAVPMACGDDDADDAAGTTTTAAGGTTTTDGNDEAETIEVTLTDYAFEGIPDEVPAGTTFTVVNESEIELHELVAIKLPDDEDRSVEELLQLPEEEQMELMGGGEPAAVLLAMPNSSDQIAAVGDGTLTEPGRYLIACFIPTGADPNEYMQAAQESEGGPPQVAGGPPHFVQGMYHELRVT